jgi:hypothetical protein
MVPQLAAVRFLEAFDEDVAVGQAKVMVRGVAHAGVPTNGYRVAWHGVSVAYVSDHQPPPGLAGVPEPVLELAAGVDLLIHGAAHGERLGVDEVIAAADGLAVRLRGRR